MFFHRRKIPFSIRQKNFKHKLEYIKTEKYSSQIEVPKQADVVIIGGGSAGCHALYHLAKKGLKPVLLERSKLTAGTTWHTAGLIWSLRPNDVDTQILMNSRKLLQNLEKETSLNPGWIQNGGIFIAHSELRLQEYKRLSSIGNVMNIENYILNPSETKRIFPLLNEKSFIGSLYSPGDGVVDPAMLCSSLVKSASMNGAVILENCPVNDFIISNDSFQGKKIKGVKTSFGNIKTDIVINATGVWGRDLTKKYGSLLPLIPMKHSYIVTESIEGVRGLPNVRDHDYSIYFRIQGDSICMGGYEPNPAILDNIPNDFNFALYDLDWAVFEKHISKAISLCEKFKTSGIKTTICGPESFTPDHKPLMGPDVVIKGLYHNCGFNSAGMMFGGGCGEQIAQWAINGEPDLPMFQYDVRRFSETQISNKRWIKERSHESYVKNYGIVFPHDQPLGGRNISLDPLHSPMLECNAFMEEKQGWERPAFFFNSRVDILPYDWYGSYNFKKNSDSSYGRCLAGDLKYTFSKHHGLVKKEALACRNNAVLFNMSYFGKMYLDGPDAELAAEWLFTADTKFCSNKVVYTCVLNKSGGVEADLTLSKISNGSGEPHNPKTNGTCFYIVSGGSSSFYIFKYLMEEIKRKGFRVNLRNATEDLGIISIQGPNARSMIQDSVNVDLSDESFPMNTTIFSDVLIQGKKLGVRILRVSFVGEKGYELHVPKNYCADIFRHIMKKNCGNGLINAGYRALYSLSSEKGYHLWGYDLRSDDTPAEANLLFTCKKSSLFKGKDMVDYQRQNGFKKKLVHLTLKAELPLWGLEGVYRNGKPVGLLRRGDYSFTLKQPLGQAYLQRIDGKNINDEFIKSGSYEVEIMGKMYPADCHTKSPLSHGTMSNKVQKS